MKKPLSDQTKVLILYEALVGMVGEREYAKLVVMAQTLVMLPLKPEDKEPMLNAIHALIACQD